MGLFDLGKNKKENYADQGSSRAAPVDGTFDVVNSKLQFQAVGSNGTIRLRVIATALHVVEADDAEGAKKMIGKTFGFDIWWHKPSKSNPSSLEDCDFNLLVNDNGDGLAFNGIKLSNLANAHGHDEDVSEQIANRDLVPLITGEPYRIRIRVEQEVRKVKGVEKTYYTVEPEEFKHLPRDARSRYKASPGWEKFAGKPDERMLENADYTPKDKDKWKGGGGSTPAKDPFAPQGDDGFYDDDLPF